MSSRPRPLHDGLVFPGHGMPERPDAGNPPLAPWARLSRGQGFGKSSNFQYDADAIAEQSSGNAFLELRGDDADACQLQVTLTSPQAIPNDTIPQDVANATGGFDNGQIGAENYPGQAGPIIWPPFSAVIRWGVGGTRAIAVVDFVNGTVINVPCSALDVFAIVTADGANVPGTSGLYTLSAFVAPGMPRPGSAQRTVHVGTLAAATESDIFVIPAFAKRVTVIGCDPGAGTPAVTVAYLRFWRSPDGTGNAGNYLVSGNQPDSFAIPNGAAYFSIVSGLSGAAAFSACYDLAI